MVWPVSIWPSARAREPHARAPSWDRLEATLTTPTVVGDKPKPDLAAWSPTIYREGTTRGQAGVEAVSCLVLDYDEGTTVEEALFRWSEWPGMLHTSISHTEATPKFRVVLPLAEPIKAREWPAVWAWANEHAGGAVDGKCKDAARLYFLPAIRSPTSPWHAQSWRPPGGFLGTDVPWAIHLEDLARPKPKPVPRPTLYVTTPKRRAYALAAMLKTDPYARLELAKQLGARVDGEPPLARRVACPQCKRAAVWFPIHPDRRHTAECNHKGSCGWYGDLFDLFTAHGGALP